MIKVERKNNQLMISVEGDVATLAGETEILLRSLRENMEKTLGKETTTELLDNVYERSKLSEKDAELFESLRELRREIASEEKVPPYMVFADKTLAGMCVMRPATRDEMLEVSGVGEHKLEKYGDRFLEILRKG